MHQSRIMNSKTTSIFNSTFMFIAQAPADIAEVSPVRPGATSTSNASQAAAHVKSPRRQIRLIRTPPNTFHISSQWQTGTSAHNRIPPIWASLTFSRNNSWSLLVSIIFIVVFSAVAWFASPKGETQTYVPCPVLFFLFTCAQLQHARELQDKTTC